MGLKDRYAQMTGAAPASPAAAPASAAPSTPPAATATPAASAPATSSSPAAAGEPTTSPAPAGRDLAAVRARLAQRTSPGVNPPEAAIPPTAFDRTTKEGPSGEAVPLENHQEVLKAAAKAAVAGTVGTAPSAGTELTRGQKAAATRAANKAAASTVAPAAAAAPSAPVSALELNAAMHQAPPFAPSKSLEERQVEALERIAAALEAANVR